jgi:CubicO group peptidase (beta-lactamase class C family)
MISPDELERYFQQRTEQDAFSGVVLITQGSSQLFAGTYGYASRSWKVSNTLTTRFDTASVTKLFTAVATLQLIDRGVLAFDTPVIDFLGLQDTAIAHAVNVFHLLTHTSGIADDAEEESGEVYADIWKTRANYAVTETADFLPQFAHKPPISLPARDAATVTAAMCCWACSSKRQAVCPIGTTRVSISSHPPKCSIPISSAWI